MKIIGITGGIGSGKTTVCAVLAERGMPVYESDKRAHDVVNTDALVRQQILALFGNEAYADGLYNRSFVAQQVFGNKALLDELSRIIHPAVKRDFLAFAERNNAAEYVFLESAILFESHFDDVCDVVVGVVAPDELRLDRAMKRDGADREQITKRMAHQLSNERMLELCDVSVLNDGVLSVPELVESLLRQLV